MTTPNTARAAGFEAAAALLAADPTLDGLGPETHDLLRYLGYADGDRHAAAGRVRLLRAAAKLRRLFQLPVPDAPGLLFLGGEADPAVMGDHNAGLPMTGLAGSGLTPSRAFESCVGEGVEYLSQFAQPGDPLGQALVSERLEAHDPHARRFIAGVLAAAGADPERPIAWHPVRRPCDGAEAWFPADLCLRRRPDQADFVPPLKLSTGCAAGVTTEAATLRALLELIERDACALWWRGGRRGRVIAPESEAGQAAATLLARLRDGQGERRSWLLDITTDLGVPAVAALSARSDGFGFAFGLGARLDLAEAARAAIFELCQVELSQHVIAAKRREGGEAALNESDRRQLRRATAFDTRTCALLRPRDTPAAVAAPPDAPASLDALLDRLEGNGITAYTLDLTRPVFDVPVVRVLAPGLQLEPCEVVGERLARVIDATGGGAAHTGDIALL